VARETLSAVEATLPSDHANPWKAAFWLQAALFLAAILAGLYWGYVALGRLQRAKLAAEREVATATELVDRLRAERIGDTSAKSIILEGPLTEIIDGDTVTLRMGNHEYCVRLHGIHAPELDQPFGEEAAQFVGQLVDSDQIQVRLTGADQDGQLVGVLLNNGRSINLELVQAGLAWSYQDCAPEDKELALGEERARAVKAGLWADPEAVAPWEWRKRN
jgi:micrococcal nuclease